MSGGHMESMGDRLGGREKAKCETLGLDEDSSGEPSAPTPLVGQDSQRLTATAHREAVCREPDEGGAPRPPAPGGGCVLAFAN